VIFRDVLKIKSIFFYTMDIIALGRYLPLFTIQALIPFTHLIIGPDVAGFGNFQDHVLLI